jgi:hypothetical protein
MARPGGGYKVSAKKRICGFKTGYAPSDAWYGEGNEFLYFFETVLQAIK